MSPDEARAFWKALVDKATSLIADAHVLLAAESYGRARSLTVLAQEELGKALWIYAAFESAWNEGSATRRAQWMLFADMAVTTRRSIWKRRYSATNSPSSGAATARCATTRLTVSRGRTPHEEGAPRRMPLTCCCTVGTTGFEPATP
ncbi:AbiV family abortive infection protein [Streptomyces chumphonensis]|uniref:AbiV family abortive infection protein n=1 Tax=Streptomyces chumphonensis TaxID=1214925 RepID=UPI001CD0E40C|nr:AbiV family abortive infection protein [Streptomyces chumphonensis]